MAKTLLNQDFIKKVSGPVHQTWGYIGGDYCDICDGRITYLEAMEVTLDADRMRTMGGKEGNAAMDTIQEAIRALGYPKVLKYLAKNIKLGF